MPDKDAQQHTSIGHPAPGRGRVGDLMLVFSFLLVPAVWSIQLVAISSLAGLACLGQNGEAMNVSSFSWAGFAIRWINVVALGLGAVGIGLTLLNVHRSYAAASPPPGGVISAGEGRVHWMAFGGVFVALVSMIAIISHAIPSFWGGMCPV